MSNTKNPLKQEYVTPHSPKGLENLRRAVVKEVAETFENHPDELNGSYQDILTRVGRNLRLSFDGDMIFRTEAMFTIACLHEQLGRFGSARDIFNELLRLYEFDDSENSYTRRNEINWHLGVVSLAEGQYEVAEHIFEELLVCYMPCSDQLRSSRKKQKKKLSIAKRFSFLTIEEVSLDVLAFAVEVAIAISLQLQYPLSSKESSRNVNEEKRVEETIQLFENIIQHLSQLSQDSNCFLSILTHRTLIGLHARVRRGYADLLVMDGRMDQALFICDESCKLLYDAQQLISNRSSDDVNDWIPDMLLATRRQRISIRLAMIPLLEESVLKYLQDDLMNIINEQQMRLSLSSQVDYFPERLPYYERELNLLDSLFLLAKEIHARPDISNWRMVEFIVRDVYKSRSKFFDSNHVDVYESKQLLIEARTWLSSNGILPLKGKFLHISIKNGALDKKMSDFDNEEETPSNNTENMDIFCGLFCF